MESSKVLKCPSCGGPLDLKDRTAITIKCQYCGASVAIPESMRSPEGPSAQYSLSDVTRLAKEGKLDEAARIYSKITGLSHENAMYSVKSIAGMQSDGQTSTPAAAPVQQPYIPPPVSGGYSRPANPRRRISCFGVFFQLIAIALPIIFFVLPNYGDTLQNLLPFDLPFEIPTGFPFSSSPENTQTFAQQVTVIGREGTEPGMFQDPRDVGVDGNGNIVVFNTVDERTQIFDSNGNFISEFIPGKFGEPLYSRNMVIATDGKIYFSTGSSILVHSQNGEILNTIKDDGFIYQHVAIGPDGTLYAMVDKDFDPTIVRYDKNGNIDLEIRNPLQYISRESETSGIIGVDNQGNIYYCDTFLPIILKFSPNGEFLDEFGGENNGGYTPGKFVSPQQIIADPYGRIYVVDFYNTQVFNPDLTYLARIEGGYDSIAFDGKNTMYAVSVLDNIIIKFPIPDPTQQTQP